MKRVLITGTARSGTGYVAEYLKRWCPLGVVGHEDVYGLHRRLHGQVVIDPNKLSWPTATWLDYKVEVSWLAAPFLDRTTLTRDTTVVVHLVRDPIKAIASIYRRGFLVPRNPYGEFAWCKLGIHFDEEKPLNMLTLACHYWCEWNMMILTSKVPMCVWRVESLAQSDLAYVLNTAQIPYNTLGPPDKGVNKGDGPHDPELVPHGLSDIPVEFQQRVSEVGRLFGYEVK